MTEEFIEVKVIKIVFKHEVCGKGYMEKHGDSFFPTIPPKYPHKCTYCGEEKIFSGVEYPHIAYKEE